MLVVVWVSTRHRALRLSNVSEVLPASISRMHAVVQVNALLMGWEKCVVSTPLLQHAPEPTVNAL